MNAVSMLLVEEMTVALMYQAYALLRGSLPWFYTDTAHSMNKLPTTVDKWPHLPCAISLTM